jgi:hypothetical protein
MPWTLMMTTIVLLLLQQSMGFINRILHATLDVVMGWTTRITRAPSAEETAKVRSWMPVAEGSREVGPFTVARNVWLSNGGTFSHLESCPKQFPYRKH